MFRHTPPSQSPQSLTPQLLQELLSLLRALLLASPSQTNLAVECARCYFTLSRPLQDSLKNLAATHHEGSISHDDMHVSAHLMAILRDNTTQVGTAYQSLGRQKALFFEQAWKIGSYFLWDAIPPPADPLYIPAAQKHCRFLLRMAHCEKEPGTPTLTRQTVQNFIRRPRACIYP